jgi:uncharacterized protein with GYD domain
MPEIEQRLSGQDSMVGNRGALTCWEVTAVPRYVALVNWTDQGIRNVKDSPKRANDFVAMAKNMGCTVQQLLFTMGPYDIVTIFEAPDAQTATSVALAVSKLGNVRTLSMPAYTPDEMGSILGKVP